MLCIVSCQAVGKVFFGKKFFCLAQALLGQISCQNFGTVFAGIPPLRGVGPAKPLRRGVFPPIRGPVYCVHMYTPLAGGILYVTYYILTDRSITIKDTENNNRKKQHNTKQIHVAIIHRFVLNSIAQQNTIHTIAITLCSPILA